MTRGAGRLVVASAALALFAAAPAGADTGTAGGNGAVETGVWWQGNQGDVALPPPPVLVDLPEDGLWLSSGPNGDAASSAVRFTVPERALPEELVLHIHQDSSTPEPALALCAPAEDWQPPEERPGPWSERAVPDCERFSTVGEVDGETVRFPLADLDSDDVDLVLTRVPDDSESYLDVTFRAPVADDLRTGSPVSSGGFVAPPTTSPGPAPAGGSSGGSGFASDSGFDADPGAALGGDFSSGADPVIDEPAGAAGTESVDDDPAPADRSASEAEIAAAEPAAAGEAWDAARWIALVAFILIGGWTAMLAFHRFRSGVPTAPFTIYRGVPPG